MTLQLLRNVRPFYSLSTDASTIRVPWLPDDVLIAIMEHLSPVELRRASTVSCRFYELSHKAGLTLHRTVPTAGKLSTWVHIVKYARAQKVVFRLSLTIDYGGVYPRVPLQLVVDTLVAVFLALPLLTNLTVWASPFITGCVLGMLTAPAPLLRSLDICQCQAANDHVTIIPASLFGSRPSSLHTVTLDVSILFQSPVPVPAFSNVRVVRLTIRGQQREISFSRLFPAATELYVRIVGAEHGVVIDLSDLSLGLLAIDNSSWGNGAVGITGCKGGNAAWVTAVEYTGGPLPQDEPLWPADAHALSARMRHARTDHGTVVEIQSADLPWRCTWHLPSPSSWIWNAERELEQLGGMHLVSLTISDEILQALAKAPISLPKLRKLSVDFTTAPFPNFFWRDDKVSVPEGTVHAVYFAFVAFYCAIVFVRPRKLSRALLELLFDVALFICVLSTASCVLQVWAEVLQNAREREKTRLSCPALNCVRLFATRDRPLVLGEVRTAPLVHLLWRSRARPRLELDAVKLDRSASFTLMWHTFRIPVFVQPSSHDS